MLSFEKTVAKLCESIVRARCEPSSSQLEERRDGLIRFVLSQHARMPDNLRMPLKACTLLFDLMGVARDGRPFHRQAHPARWRQVESWRGSFFPFERDLIRFYEGLVVYCWYSDVWHLSSRPVS
jgi:hypothetical protein